LYALLQVSKVRKAGCHKVTNDIKIIFCLLT
jgi:hypothetical protein